MWQPFELRSGPSHLYTKAAPAAFRIFDLGAKRLLQHNRALCGLNRTSAEAREVPTKQHRVERQGRVVMGGANCAVKLPCPACEILEFHREVRYARG